MKILSQSYFRSLMIPENYYWYSSINKKRIYYANDFWIILRNNVAKVYRSSIMTPYSIFPTDEDEIFTQFEINPSQELNLSK